MSSALDLAIHLAVTGVDAVTSAFGNIIESTHAAGAGFRTAVGDANSFENALDAISAKGQQFEGAFRVFDKMKEHGAYAQQAGRGVLSLAESWQQAAREGNGISQRFDDLLDQQHRLADAPAIETAIKYTTEKGHFNDDDPVREAATHMASFSMRTDDISAMLPLAARQARTMTHNGQAMDTNSVADVLGKGYNDLNVDSLKRSQIAVGDNDQAELDKVKKEHGIEAARDKWMSIVSAAIEKNTVTLENSLTDGEKKENDTARVKDDVQTGLGEGVESASAVFNETMGVVFNGLMGLEKAHPGLLKFAGATAAVVGGVLVVGGGLLVMAGTLAGAYVNILAFTSARVAATATEAAAVGAATAATGAHAGAAGVDAAATGTDAAAVGVHTVAVETNAAATASASAVLIAAALPVILTLGALAVAIAALGYVAYQYVQELNKPTASTQDDRTGEEASQDGDNAKKIHARVDGAEADAHISSKDKLTIYNQASKKLNDLGDTDGAEEMQKKIADLKATAGGRKARDEMNHGDKAVSSEAQAVLNDINGTGAHTEKLRANALGDAGKPADSPSGMNAEVEGAKQQATTSKAGGGGGGTPDAGTAPAASPDATVRAQARLSDIPGGRTRIEFAPIDLSQGSVQRAGVDYMRTRPA